jgi:hypothetical protein
VDLELFHLQILQQVDRAQVVLEVWAVVIAQAIQEALVELVVLVQLEQLAEQGLLEALVE